MSDNKNKSQPPASKPKTVKGTALGKENRSGNYKGVNPIVKPPKNSSDNSKKD